MAIKHVHILVVPNNEAAAHQVPKQVIEALTDDNVVAVAKRIYMRESKWDAIKSELEVA
jgi:hypothetical protein